jgi:hypothetical protein
MLKEKLAVLSISFQHSMPKEIPLGALIPCSTILFIPVECYYETFKPPIAFLKHQSLTIYFRFGIPSTSLKDDAEPNRHQF